MMKSKMFFVAFGLLLPCSLLGQGGPGTAVSPSQIGDSASIARFIDSFRKANVPDATSLKLAFAQMPDGTTDFFSVLTKGVSPSATDSLHKGLFALVSKPREDFARRPVTIEVVAGDSPQVKAWESRRTSPKFQNRDRVAQAVSLAGRNVGAQGTVHLWLLVNENGQISKTRVESSSGNVQLDKAVESAARVARFSPGEIEGVVVETWIRVPFVVRIQ